jgi:hypothetical protein
MDRTVRRATVAVALTILLSPLRLTAQGRADLPGPQQKETRGPNERQDETDQLRAIATELRAINERQARIEARGATNQSQQWPPNWSNWALVAVGILAAGAAVNTLRAIEREVIETGKAAAAAKQSADIARDALYVGERAYVHVQDRSLRIIRTPGYNYDRPRTKGEGTDWNGG